MQRMIDEQQNAMSNVQELASNLEKEVLEKEKYHSFFKYKN